MRKMQVQGANIHSQLYQVLNQHFGYTHFKTGQLEAIESILSKRDTLLVLPTSGGKSICYQLPSLLFEKLTLVISPLISLMEDQVREARLRGRRDVAAWHSGITQTERKQLLQQLPHYKLLYVSPEALQSSYLINILRRRGIDLFVIDEAHCISQWGHDFRLDYLRLAEARELLGKPTCLALTATATESTQEDIIYQLRLKEPTQLVYSVDRENIYIHVEQMENEYEKQQRLLRIIKERQDAGIIYCATRAQAENLYHLYSSKGVEGIAYYHGGMTAEERQLIHHQYLHNELKVIFATNAFGMGINKPNIRYVVHYHAPFQLESYVQEMGRCCRDGRQGSSIIFVQEGDHQLAQHFLGQEFLTEEQLLMLCRWLGQANLQAILEQKNWRTQLINELLLILQCHEQALQHALYFWEDFWQPAQEVDHATLARYEVYLRRKIEERKSIRMAKLAKTRAWLSQAEGCRRQLLTAYFNHVDFTLSQDGTKQSLNKSACCDLCQASDTLLSTDIDESKGYAIHNDESISDKLNRLWPVKK